MYTSRAILAVSVFLVVGDAFRKKSSKADAELDGGSFAEVEASTRAAERVQTMKDMKALAHKVVAGEEKILPSTLDALKKVMWVIQKAEAEVVPQFDEHQGELDDAKERLDNCTGSYLTRTEEIREKEGKKTAELGDIHNKSRYKEQALLDRKAKACGAFQDKFTGLRPPACTHPFPGECDFKRRKSCLDEIKAWSDENKAIYKPMKELCEKASEEHGNASKLAKVNQGKFEWEQCRWDTELHDACEYFEEYCWYNALIHRATVHSRIYNISEPALKAEFIAIQKIKCYVNVLKAAEPEMPAELKRCEDEEYNRQLRKRAEDELSNTYHGIPTKPECEMQPPPCDEKWKQITYASQKVWFEFTAGKRFCPKVFPNGAEKVKLTDCLEDCPDGKINPKCTASVYSENDFTGNVATFSVGDYRNAEFVNRGPLRDNKASSIKVQGPPACRATLYGEDDFNGWSAEFPVGEFKHDKFFATGAKNNEASSIKVTLG